MNTFWFQSCKQRLANWSHVAFPSRAFDGISAPQVSALEARILFDANPVFGDNQELANLDLSLDFESFFLPAELPFEFATSSSDGGNFSNDVQEFSSSAMPLDGFDSVADGENSASGSEIVVIDASVDDFQAILDSLEEQSGLARDFIVLVTRPDQDGIVEITKALNQLENVTAIHIISHARDGEIFLGNAVLDFSSLADRAGELASWRTQLSSNADLLFYGCDLAASNAGEQLVGQLSGLIGADIAASTDLSGSKALGGDWDLEYRAGLINTLNLAASHTFDAWHGLLATTTSSVTTGDQQTTDASGGSQHAIAMDATGDFVVVWSSNDNQVGRDTDGFGVYAQRYDRFGAKVGTEIVVNNQRADDQDQASVAMDDAGNFVVVWADHTISGPGIAIKVMAKRYDANGIVIMSDTLITSVSNDSINPTVAMNSIGEYVIAWQSAATNNDVFATSFDSNGTTVASGFRVHAASPDSEINPSVAIADDGSFAVFWQDSTESHGNRFDRFGTSLLGSPLTIFGSLPGVAVDNDGSMLVTYNSGNEIWADKYSPVGSLTSSQSLSGPLSWVSDPTVSRANDGSYIVSWNGDGAGFDISNVFVAQLSSTGTVIGVSELVDTAFQYAGSVAAHDVNHYAYAYTTTAVLDSDVEVGQVGTWGSPPTSADTTGVTNENISYTFAPSDFPFVDADSDPFIQIRILTNATNGSLLLNGAAVLPLQVVTVAQLVAGQLVFAPNANENGAPYATFDFQVNDGNSYSSAQTFTINAIPIDDPPQILPPTSFNVAENQTTVGTITASDPDSAILTYSILGGVDSAKFAIDSSTGALRFVTARDFETPTGTGTNNVYDVVVQVSDGGLSHTQALTVTVTDVDEFDVGTISDTNVSANAVAENAVNGTVVGITASASDADATTNVITYTLNDTAGGRFAINGSTGVVTVANGTLLDYEAAASHDIIVRATSSDSSFSTALFTINIDPVNENSPIITSNGGGTTASINLAENSTAVTTVTAMDSDLPSQTLTYSIIGGADSVKFLIDSLTGELSFVIPPDYEFPDDFEANRTYEVIVGVSDGAGGSDSQLLNIIVDPVNDNAPVFSSPAMFNVDENTTTVGTIVAADADQAAQTVSFSIAGGADASKFTLSGNILRFNFGRNFESPGDSDIDNVYEVNILANDGFGGTTLQSVSAVVVNVNESPSNITPRDIFVNENTDTTSGYSAGVLTATDPDAADSFTFSIVGGVDRSNFTIGGVNGDELILTAGILDYEQNDAYEVRVRVRDAGGRTTERDISVHVRDINEAPTAIDPARFNLDENTDTTSGRYLGSLAATDQDIGESFSYTIFGGADAANFSLTGIDGDRLVLNAGLLNFEAQASYVVIVRATDSGGLSVDQAITVDVNDVNEAPLATGESITLLEGAMYSAPSGWLTANDIDPESDYLTASVVSGPQHGSLQLLANGSFNYQHDGSETGTDRFEYSINDGNGHSAQAWAEIVIVPVNDLPDARRDTIVLSNFAPIVLDPSVLLNNDFDAEGSLTISLVHAAQNGTVLLGTDGKIYYTPIPTIQGFDQFVYQVVDSNGAVDQAVVTIITPKAVEVKPSDPPPGSESEPKPVPDDLPPIASTPPRIDASVVTPNAIALQEQFAPNPAAGDELDEGSFEGANPGALKDVRSTSDVFRQARSVLSVSSAINAFALEDLTRSTVTIASYNMGVIQNLDKLMYSSPIWSELLGVTQDIVSESKFRVESIATVASFSGALSVGYAFWLVRGGMLLAGLASSMPAWRLFDPFSVLQISAGGAKDDETDSLESLVAGDNQAKESTSETSHVAPVEQSQESTLVS